MMKILVGWLEYYGLIPKNDLNAGRRFKKNMILISEIFLHSNF